MKRTINSLYRISKIFVKSYTGYYFFIGVYYLLKKMKLIGVQYPIRYHKQLPFHILIKSLHKVRLIAQFFFTLAITSLITLILLNNLAPFGITRYYALGQREKSISDPGPKNRVKIEKIKGEKVFRQVHDLAYFTTDMPFSFDTAKVTITFQNQNLEQNLLLGFQDQKSWHYDMKTIDTPLLNNLTWNRIGKSPVLYQETQLYTSVNDFLSKIPKDSIVGIYGYDADLGNVSYTKIPNYKPSNQKTVINTPLRGRNVIYTYLDNEPFHMTIEKQDLNWYEDPDTMTISVYKGKILLYQTTEDDDGIQDSSRKVLPPQKIEINSPEKVTPERGVYKIIIRSNGDSIIKKISTNLHKIVFQGSIFPVANHEVYGNAVSSTSATTIFTNSPVLTAMTNHKDGLQDILVGDQILRLNTIRDDESIIPKENLTKVIIPKNDLIIRGFLGYFAFTEDQFFLPTDYHILPITKKEDLNLVNYVLTDYTPSKKIGDWRVTERIFDMRSAYIKNGKLSWLIQAPDLEENGRNTLIKDITVEFHKKSWF